MFSNVRFATNLHILVLLDQFDNSWVSSSLISGSTGVNSAIIRKELAELKKAGLIVSKEGKGGGVKLAQNSEEITLSDIYNLIRTVDHLGKYNKPNPDCTVGKNINKQLDILYASLDQQLEEKLSAITLKEFSTNFNN